MDESLGMRYSRMNKVVLNNETPSVLCYKALNILQREIELNKRRLESFGVGDKEIVIMAFGC